MRLEVVTTSEGETRALGRDIASKLGPGSVVALSGDLGTGKTALVRGICEFFGCADQVTSPTFTIMNDYRGSIPVNHCDLYRLHSIEEMLAIGFDDIFEPDCIVLVEWAERAVAILPTPRIEIICRHGEQEQTRRYLIADVLHPQASMLAAEVIPQEAAESRP
jgi:tRNA threonylcarbamoyladenosine biosynthesis protein TsaE